MRCIGRTNSFKRCKNQASGKLKLTCHIHWWQPFFLLLITIPAILGSYIGIYRGFIEPIISITGNQVCIEEHLKPIRTEYRHLVVSEYVPNEKIAFSIIFHFKNYSDCIFKDYKATSYGISIGNGIERPIIVKSQTHRNSEYKILPQSQFRLNGNTTTWIAPKKDLNFSDFIGINIHEYYEIGEKTKIVDYEYYYLVFNEHQNKISTGVPPDHVIENFKPILDSLKNIR